jgi:hypothetical protein
VSVDKNVFFSGDITKFFATHIFTRRTRKCSKNFGKIKQV